MFRAAAAFALVAVVAACAGQSASETNVSVAPRSTSLPDRSNPEVFAPVVLGSYPVVVTVPGGGWMSGDPAQMRDLAMALAERGMVTVNIGYRAMESGGRFPGMVEDIACGVNQARALAEGRTDTPDDVYVVAHSAGAHLAALVAFAPDLFPCPDGHAAEIDGFIGLAGPYDVTRLAILNTFFGVTLDEAPERWADGNPQTYANTAPDIPILLLHGNADEVVPSSFSVDLAEALTNAGRDAELSMIDGGTHSDLRDPHVVGDAIAEFVLSP